MNFKVDSSVAGVLGEVIIIDRFLGNVGDLDLDVLWAFKRGAEIMFLTPKEPNLASFWERTLLRMSLNSSRDSVLLYVYLG